MKKERGPELKREELKLNHIYKAKRSRVAEVFSGNYNDRQIIHLGIDTVQYDSPTVRNGRHFPTVSMEKFLQWAERDITEVYQTIPLNKWRDFELK